MKSERMWLSAFEAAFLHYRNEMGLPEDAAIELAEHDAQQVVDRYFDAKLHGRIEDGKS